LSAPSSRTDAHRRRTVTTVIDFYYALDGSSYTLDAEGYVDVTVPSGLQANSSFNITLSANDGTTKQTESVPVQIKASCKRHY
jgi:hypothetical protein